MICAFHDYLAIHVLTAQLHFASFTTASGAGDTSDTVGTYVPSSSPRYPSHTGPGIVDSAILSCASTLWFRLMKPWSFSSCAHDDEAHCSQFWNSVQCQHMYILSVKYMYTMTLRSPSATAYIIINVSASFCVLRIRKFTL